MYATKDIGGNSEAFSDLQGGVERKSCLVTKAIRQTNPRRVPIVLCRVLSCINLQKFLDTDDISSSRQNEDEKSFFWVKKSAFFTGPYGECLDEIKNMSYDISATYVDSTSDIIALSSLPSVIVGHHHRQPPAIYHIIPPIMALPNRHADIT